MARSLSHIGKIYGVSRNKILLISFIIIIVLFIIILFADSDGNTEVSDDNLQHDAQKYINNGSNYIQTNNSKQDKSSINNILEKIKESEATVMPQQSSLAISNINDKYDNNTMVPPIEIISHKATIPPLSNKALYNTKHVTDSLSPDYDWHDNLDNSTNSDKSQVWHAKSLIYASDKSQNNKNNIHETLNNNSNSSNADDFIDISNAQNVKEENNNNSIILAKISEEHKLPENYLDTNIIKPYSKYELKAGSIIPATMINGLNSDLTGEVIAIVRSNVYDSITRRYVLIPQGSRLVGLYDSNILYGQERVAVIWHHLIYPDGSTVSLKSMSGSDIEGYSGFHDIVDNKYWKLFGSSLVIGFITGAMQYNQSNINPNNTNNPNNSISQTMSNSLGQQLGQTGLSVVQKNLNIKPTIIIRPNYPFSILTTADMILKPYDKL